MFYILHDGKMFMVCNQQTTHVIADNLTRKGAEELLADLQQGTTSEERASLVHQARHHAALGFAAGRNI